MQLKTLGRDRLDRWPADVKTFAKPAAWACEKTAVFRTSPDIPSRDSLAITQASFYPAV